MFSFNTSHVVVYRRRNAMEIRDDMFQYISCCSLSNQQMLNCLHPLRFNTSHVVVYLSRNSFCGFLIKVSIHLMLQFISSIAFFNSSKRLVSIHLMLQFITSQLPSHYRLRQFQYISCCSLSQRYCNSCYEWRAFQYISCCSLSSTMSFAVAVPDVSIHLMLQFI